MNLDVGDVVTVTEDGLKAERSSGELSFIKPEADAEYFEYHIGGRESVSKLGSLSARIGLREGGRHDPSTAEGLDRIHQFVGQHFLEAREAGAELPD